MSPNFTSEKHRCVRRRIPVHFTLIVLLSLLSDMSRVVVAFSAQVICNKIPGLTSSQRNICISRPNVMAAVGEGVKLAHQECQRQFKNHRWNCSSVARHNAFGHIISVGSKEAAFVYAITSAGVVYAIAKSCQNANITCECDQTLNGKSPAEDWEWGGCSVSTRYGIRIARKFFDSREMEGDQRSFMNLHNNRAGRRALKYNLETSCKCHGVSGSCTTKTCWKTLPHFHHIGNYLMKRYTAAKKANFYEFKAFDGHQSDGNLLVKHRQRKSDKFHSFHKPRDLIYIENSPNYCEANYSLGSFGTVSRACNRTSAGSDSCDLMCCGRGYNTHHYTRTWQCHCKFMWCCHVSCKICNEKVEAYTCK